MRHFLAFRHPQNERGPAQNAVKMGSYSLHSDQAFHTFSGTCRLHLPPNSKHCPTSKTCQAGLMIFPPQKNRQEAPYPSVCALSSV